MGLFTKIKQLFFKNEQPKIASNEIVGFDTSLVYIPQYKSLSDKEKQQVDKYIKQTSISNIEDIIYYGSQMSNYSTGIVDILLSLFYKITDEDTNKNLSNEDLLKLGVNTLITNEEIMIYQNMLKDLEREATLRTVALEQIFKQWKNSHKMLDSFAKEKRRQKQHEKASFEAAIERMKISKKIIEEQLQITINALNSNRNACRFY